VGDSSHIFCNTYENKVWLEYYRRKFSANRDRHAFFLRNSKDSKPMIDYDKTYSTIFSNPHILFQTSSLLSDHKEVYGTTLYRARYLYQIGKIVLYQLLILSCQYCTPTALGLMFSIEICYICLVLVCYIRRRHLKNVFFLVMELSQPVLLFFYLLICLLIYSKSTVPEAYQDVGMWLVIVSCIIEYLLLIAFVCVTVYIFCKNKKSQKSKGKAAVTFGSNWLFISYYDIPSPHGSLQPDIERINKRENSIQDSLGLQIKKKSILEAKLEYISRVEQADMIPVCGSEEIAQKSQSESTCKKDVHPSIFPSIINHKPFQAVRSRGSLKIVPPALESLGKALHRGSLFNKPQIRATRDTPESAKQAAELIDIQNDTKQDEPQQTNNEASEPKLIEVQKDKDECELSETPTMPNKNPLLPKVLSNFPFHKHIVKVVDDSRAVLALTTNQVKNTRPAMRITETGDLNDADEIQSIDIG
jgi:hypothetical protein